MTRIFDKVSEGNSGTGDKQSTKKKRLVEKFFPGIENSSTAVFCVPFCTRTRNNLGTRRIMINESGGKLANWLPLLLLLLALLAKWQAEFLMVSPMQTKPKAIDKKTTSTFEVAEPGAAPTQSINHAL